MRRRTLLSAGVGLLSTAGCLGADASGGDQAGTPTETPAYDPDGAFRTERIGDRTGEIIPHQVGIWNAVDDARSIAVTVVDETAGATRLDRTDEVPGDTALAIELRAPARYRLTVRVPAATLERAFDVPRSPFDTCNDSISNVSVHTDRITVRTLSTELACLTETP
jgi:hypothetical protein